MMSRSIARAERDTLALQLKEEKEAVQAKDEEIEALKLRAQELDNTRERLEVEDISCWGHKRLSRNQRLRLFLIYGFSAKQSLKRKTEKTNNRNGLP